MEKDKIVFKGSHPDSLYRVPADGVTNDKMTRILRMLRWPVALLAVCVALAVFVYFLMPDNIDSSDASNQTLWDPVAAAGNNYKTKGPAHRPHLLDKNAPKRNDGTKTPEIDFYDAESDKNTEYTPVTDTNDMRVQPIKPVFPSHITLEVQYGNERADADKLRTPKVLDPSTPSADSTVKPHITIKPEKPLAVYFKDLNEATTIAAETISRAETVNEFPNYGEKQTTKKVEFSTKSHPTAYKDHRVKPVTVNQYLVTEEPEVPPEVLEFYGPQNVEANFTSGHSMLFGISIEDAEKLKSTTQSSVYNTRVSPTLPTWRDGDDSTTKNYPPANYTADEAPLCRSTRFTLCRGVLPYDLAGFPVKIEGVDFAAFMPHIQYLVGANCSQRSKQFLCALLEPECNPYPHQTKMPCYNLCRAIVDSCEGSISKTLMPAFNCKRYSETECIAARAPCYDREMTCGDGTCIPKEWVCDNHRDCPGGEDEAGCSSCANNEYRCSSGGCILNRWLCDGYADCPGGEDEVEACDRHVAGEPGEESAGSAPAPAVRRPNRLPARGRDGHFGKVSFPGETDNSKELLVTSDSNNSFKRNFTRRPSLSRLSPYTRSTTSPLREMPPMRDYKPYPLNEPEPKTQQEEKGGNDSMEDINIGDLGIFEEIKKSGNDKVNDNKPSEQKQPRTKPVKSQVSATTLRSTRLDKTINKFEKVIDGVALMQKQVVEDQEAAVDSPETNATNADKEDFPIAQRPVGSISAHASPCPSGELRCVDGRCITLSQLCDGTIDCTDHADEDNCFT